MTPPSASDRPLCDAAGPVDVGHAGTGSAGSAGPRRAPRHFPDRLFWLALSLMGGLYVALIVSMVVAEAAFTSRWALAQALRSEPLRFSIQLSLLSCSITTLLCLWVGTPLAYLLSRWGAVHSTGDGRRSIRTRLLHYTRLWIDAIVDIPIVLPPLVVGLCLLILFRHWPLYWIDQHLSITYAAPAVILAQFMVSCAFAVRSLRVTFDQINPRAEQVALTLGCSRSQAFWRVVLPEARRGLFAAATLAWARALGEFGPVLVFAGATRMKTEVLSTSVFLYLNTGELEMAVAVSLLMVLTAVLVMVLLRSLGGSPVGPLSRRVTSSFPAREP